MEARKQKEDEANELDQKKGYRMYGNIEAAEEHKTYY